jgi:hypothetical protein
MDLIISINYNHYNKLSIEGLKDGILREVGFDRVRQI